MAIKLTAGDNSGFFQGYARAGNSAGMSAFGSISEEPIPGQVVDYFCTGSSGDALAFVGNQSPTLLSSLTVNGTTWTVGAGTFNGTSTEYPLTTSGGEFVNGTGYDIHVAGGPVYGGPTYIGQATGLGSNNATSVNFTSSGRAAGDLIVLAIASANQAITPPTGFVEISGGASPQSRGTAGAAGGIRLGVFTKVSDGTEGNLTVADTGDITIASGIVVRGVSGAAVELHVSGGKNVASTASHSGNALTTTVDDCLIVDLFGTDRDFGGANYSGQANPDLTGLAERVDNGTSTTTGAGLMITTGEKRAAGAVSATTATQAAASVYCSISIALKNASSGSSSPVGRADETDSSFALARVQLGVAGRSDESATSIARAAVQVRLTGLAIETDGALVLAPKQLAPVGRADETDAALQLGAGGSPVGLASEIDAALNLAAVQIFALGRAQESSAAFALGRVQVATIGRANETDSALARGSGRPVQAAIETDTAVPRGMALPIGRADEVDTAIALAQGVVGLVGRADEVDVAFARGIAASLGLASEIDIARALGAAIPVQVAIEIDVAFALIASDDVPDVSPGDLIGGRFRLRVLQGEARDRILPSRARPLIARGAERNRILASRIRPRIVERT